MGLRVLAGRVRTAVLVEAEADLVAIGGATGKKFSLYQSVWEGIVAGV